MDFLQECTRRRESQFHGVVVYKHFSGANWSRLRYVYGLGEGDARSWLQENAVNGIV